MLLAVVFPVRFYHGSLLPVRPITEKEKIFGSRCCAFGEWGDVRLTNTCAVTACLCFELCRVGQIRFGGN